MTGSFDIPPLPPKRPKAVDRALLFLWASVGLGALSTFVLFTVSGAQPSWILATIAGVLGVAFLVTKIATGHNWARFAMLILFAIGTVSFLLSAGTALSKAPLLLVIGLFLLLLQGGALCFLFTKPGDSWFRPI